MEYKKWMLATSITTMMMTVVGIFAAITYYYSLIDLSLRIYILTYAVILLIIVHIFIYVLKIWEGD